MDARLVNAGVESEIPKRKNSAPDQKSQQPACLRSNKGHGKKTCGKEERADYHQPQFTESLYEFADQSTLNDHGNDANVGEEVTVLMGVVTKAEHRVERKRCRHDRERDDEKKIYDEHKTETWLLK